MGFSNVYLAVHLRKECHESNNFENWIRDCNDTAICNAFREPFPFLCAMFMRSTRGAEPEVECVRMITRLTCYLLMQSQFILITASKDDFIEYAHILCKKTSFSSQNYAK